MQKILFFFLVLLSFSNTLKAQSDTTEINQSGYFLTFVKKVYLNPTVYLRTQDFKENTNLSFVALPDLASDKTNASSGFEKGLQKVLRFLMQSDGGVRFYFNPDSTTHPFRFWYSDNLGCKFKQADKDSIDYYLNHNFADGNISMTNALRFETTIDKALDYIEKCLSANPETCGNEPQNETTEINTKPLEISLHNRQGSKFAIDSKRFERLESNYAVAFDVYTQSFWFAPAKLMVVNEGPEPLALAIHSNEGDFQKQNLKISVFKTQMNLSIDPSSTEDSVFFQLPSTLSSGEPIEIIVKYKSPKDSLTYTVGLFMVNAVQRKTEKLFVVKRNLDVFPQNLISVLENKLDEVYNPVGVDFEIETRDIEGFSDDVLTIEIDNSGLFSNYTQELRPYVSSIKEIIDYNDDNYYLFFGLNCVSMSGYMPRARNIGFIFDNDTLLELAQTSVHEIGHGAFHFRHIFDEEELGEEQRGLTKNIMDYVNDPEELYVHQWNYIQDPAFVSWFSGDDDEAAINKGKCFYYKLLVDIVGNDTIIKSRTFRYQAEWYKNGNASNPYCVPCNHTHAIDMIFEKRNGEEVLLQYKQRNLVTYINEVVDRGFNHQNYGYLSSSNWLKVFESETDNGKAPDAIYQVTKLFREGQSSVYQRTVQDAYLKNYCEHYLYSTTNQTPRYSDYYAYFGANQFAPSNYCKEYYFNDLYLSDQFREFYDLNSNKSCEILTWLKSNPNANSWPSLDAENGAKAKFNLQLNDIHNYINSDGVNYFGEAIVTNNNNPDNGIIIWLVKQAPFGIGSAGEWIREPIVINNPSFANSNSHIHEKYGHTDCNHSLLNTSYLLDQLEEIVPGATVEPTVEVATSIATFLNSHQDCFVYSLPLDLRKRIVKLLAPYDWLWADEDSDYKKNPMKDLFLKVPNADKAGLFTFFTGGGYYVFRKMYSQLNDWTDGDDIDQTDNVVTPVLSKVMSYNPNPNPTPKKTGNYLANVKTTLKYIMPVNKQDQVGDKQQVIGAMVPIILRRYKNDVVGLLYYTFQASDGKYYSGAQNTSLVLGENGLIGCTSKFKVHYNATQEFSTLFGNEDNTYFEIDDTYVLDPTQIVSVLIADDIGPLGFEEGQFVQMTAIEAFYLQQLIHNANFTLAAKVIATIGGIALTIAFPPAGPALIAIEAGAVGLGVADLAVTAFRENDPANYYNEVYTDWDAFYAKASIGLGAGAILCSWKSLLTMSRAGLCVLRGTKLGQGVVSLAKFIAPKAFKSVEFVGSLSSVTGVAFKNSDGLVDLIVHGEGSKFRVFIDKTEKLVSAEELGNYIANFIPNNKTIRLLSCANLEAAEDLAKFLKRDVIASADEVKLYADGTIETSQLYKINKNGAKTEVQNSTPPLAGTNRLKFMRLGGEGKKHTLPSNSPNPNAVPSGTRTSIPSNADDATRTSLIRENEAADILAKKGFDIEQNPNLTNTSKNPDYRIEGEIFDCYSPYTAEKSVRNIWSEVKGKIDAGQTERVVINLKGWDGSLIELQKQFTDFSVDGLLEVIVINKNNTISNIIL